MSFADEARCHIKKMIGGDVFAMVSVRSLMATNKLNCDVTRCLYMYKYVFVLSIVVVFLRADALFFRRCIPSSRT